MDSFNIITCILNIVHNHTRGLDQAANTHNRLHAMGEPFEAYIKDAFSSAMGSSAAEKKRKYNETFSYGGNTHNPPDAILKNGAAIEIKKVESIGSIPLNSSYPKSKLYRTDPRISSHCRTIEGGTWESKDIIYAIGCVKKDGSNNLNSLALIYGSIYCADKECYERLFNTVKQKIGEAPLSFTETNELAHINSVDPLGITYFRARGMWGISHPFNVFDYIHHYNSNSQFELMAIIPLDIFNSFNNKDILIRESQENPHLKISDSQVTDPNNTANMINIKLITYVV